MTSTLRLSTPPSPHTNLLHDLSHSVHTQAPASLSPSLWDNTWGRSPWKTCILAKPRQGRGVPRSSSVRLSREVKGSEGEASFVSSSFSLFLSRKDCTYTSSSTHTHMSGIVYEAREKRAPCRRTAWKRSTRKKGPEEESTRNALWSPRSRADNEREKKKRERKKGKRNDERRKKERRKRK